MVNNPFLELQGQPVFLWLLKNWMIPNHYITRNGRFTKHPLKHGCLGYQVSDLGGFDLFLKLFLSHFDHFRLWSSIRHWNFDLSEKTLGFLRLDAGPGCNVCVCFLYHHKRGSTARSFTTTFHVWGLIWTQNGISGGSMCFEASSRGWFSLARFHGRASPKKTSLMLLVV